MISMCSRHAVEGRLVGRGSIALFLGDEAVAFLNKGGELFVGGFARTLPAWTAFTMMSFEPHMLRLARQGNATQDNRSNGKLATRETIRDDGLYFPLSTGTESSRALGGRRSLAGIVRDGTSLGAEERLRAC